MSEVSISVAGDARTVPAGTTAADLFEGERAVIAARINGQLRDLAAAVDDGDVVEAVAIDSADGRSILRHSTAHVMAQAVQDLFPGTLLGIGPPIENGFYYDFGAAAPVHARRPQADREADARDRQGGPDLPAPGRHRRRRPRRAGRRAVQARADRAQGGIERNGRGVGRGRRRRADHLRQPASRRIARVEGPVPRAAPADDPRHPGVQADAQRRRLLAGQREEPAAAAHLRHRVGVARRPEGAPARCSRRPRSATTASSASSSTCSASPTSSAPASPVFHPKGGVIRKEMEDYSRAKHVEAGYEFVNTPHITKEQAVRDLRPPRLVRRRHVPADAPRRRARPGRRGAQARPGLLPQADELPDAHPDLRARGRSYRELPLRMFEFGTVYRLREVRRDPRPDPGARHDPGRRAHLHHRRRHARRAALAADLRARPAARLRPRRLLPRAVDPKNPDKYVGDDDVWEAATATLAEVAAESGLELVPDPGGAAFYGPKISVQARDAIGRTWQMSTIQLDFNLPERFELEYQGAGRRAAPAGDDPPRAVRLDRAVLRRADRALRRRLPGLAGAGAGRRHPDHRRARAVPRVDRR